MAPDILPGYSWSRSVGRYRSDDSGRFVARADVVGLLQAQTDGLEGRVGALTQALIEGNLAPAYYAEQVSTELRRAHLQQVALAAGGWDRLTPADYGSVGRKLRDDYARVLNMATDATNGTVTLPQALNRVSGWAGNARLGYWEALRRHAEVDANSVLLDKRNLGVAEHCRDCLTYHEQGWQPSGVLPVPGQASQCTTHCRCTMTSRTVPVSEAGEWIGTRRQ
jgi:hypothetical protein